MMWSMSFNTVGIVLPQVWPPSVEVLRPTPLNRFSVKSNWSRNVISLTKNGLLAIKNLLELVHDVTGFPNVAKRVPVVPAVAWLSLKLGPTVRNGSSVKGEPRSDEKLTPIELPAVIVVGSLRKGMVEERL